MIFSPNQITVEWAKDILSKNMNSIELSIERLVVDSDFPAKITALLGFIKNGESSYGQWDESFIDMLNESLSRNHNINYLGEGSYSICISGVNAKTCYKINILTIDIDCFADYAKICHDIPDNPLLPNIYTVCEFKGVYCIEMDILEPIKAVGEDPFDFIAQAIDSKQPETLKKALEGHSDATVEQCNQLIDILYQSMLNFSLHSRFVPSLDVSECNTMWFNGSFVFNDPVC